VGLVGGKRENGLGGSSGALVEASGAPLGFPEGPGWGSGWLAGVAAAGLDGLSGG